MRSVSMNPLYQIPDRGAQLLPAVTDVIGFAFCGRGEVVKVKTEMSHAPSDQFMAGDESAFSENCRETAEFH